MLGYRVGYQEINGNNKQKSKQQQPQTYTFKSVEVRQHFGGEATIQGLSKYTTYNIVVQVCLNQLRTLFNLKISSLSLLIEKHGTFFFFRHITVEVQVQQANQFRRER